MTPRHRLPSRLRDTWRFQLQRLPLLLPGGMERMRLTPNPVANLMTMLLHLILDRLLLPRRRWRFRFLKVRTPQRRGPMSGDAQNGSMVALCTLTVGREGLPR